MNGRRQLFPRGRMLGGSFIFNGAQYIRGNPADFDHWRQLGNPGWGYEDVLPYFRKSEDYRGTPSPYHGTEGRLPVAKPPMVNPLTRIYLQACAQAGHPLNGDFNGASQDGFGIYDFNIAEGRRMTTARAFLRPAMARPNLHVATGALVRRVILRDGQAVGVEYERGGKIETAMARREIVLAAGSFNSPKLLMLSGIGDPRDLAPHGISVTHVLRGVGKNLQDHVNVSVAHAAKQPISFARTLRVHRLAAAMLQGVLLKRGQITQSPLEAGASFPREMAWTRPSFRPCSSPGIRAAACGFGCLGRPAGGAQFRDPCLAEPAREPGADVAGLERSQGAAGLRSELPVGGIRPGADPCGDPRDAPHLCPARLRCGAGRGTGTGR